MSKRQRPVDSSFTSHQLMHVVVIAFYRRFWSLGFIYPPATAFAASSRKLCALSSTVFVVQFDMSNTARGTLFVQALPHNVAKVRRYGWGVMPLSARFFIAKSRRSSLLPRAWFDRPFSALRIRTSSYNSILKGDGNTQGRCCLFSRLPRAPAG